MNQIVIARAELSQDRPKKGEFLLAATGFDESRRVGRQ